jgi:hypothetical protein
MDLNYFYSQISSGFIPISLGKFYDKNKYICVIFTPSKLLFVPSLINSDAGWNSKQHTVV